MEQVEIGISRDVILNHLLIYSNSLKQYQERYLPIWGLSPDEVPVHYPYVCPVCLINGFWLADDTSFYTTGIEFSLDHYPPQSVGGFEKIVVCKTCNNYAGANYEDGLRQKLQDMSFSKGVPGAALKVKSVISDVQGRYSSKMSIRPDGHFEISFKPNQKAHVPHLDNWLEKSPDDPTWKANVTIPVADETKVSRALIKAAYLYCFAAWGYEFAYSYTGSKIRRIICGHEEYPLKNPSFWLGGLTGPGKQLPVGVCYLFNNPEFKCFMVNMALTDGATKYSNLASVLIPGPLQEHWDELTAKQLILDGEPIMDISMDHVKENLISNTMLNGYTESWKVLLNK